MFPFPDLPKMMNSSNMTSLYLATSSRCHVSDIQSIIAIIVHCIIIIVGALGNSLILYVFKPRRKQSRYDLLIWYLSLFDLSGVIIVIVDVYETFTCYRNWPFGWLGCKTLYPLYYLSINMSVCMLLLIAIDRYRCLVTPFKKKFTTTNIHCAVFVSLSFCVTLQWYQFETLFIRINKVTGYIRCVQNRDSLIYLLPRFFTLMLRDVGFIVIFSLTTYKINCKLIERNKRNLLNQQLLESSLKPTKRRARVWRTFVMITIMGVTFGVLVLPLDALECTLLVSRLMPHKYRLEIT